MKKHLGGKVLFLLFCLESARGESQNPHKIHLPCPSLLVVPPEACHKPPPVLKSTDGSDIPQAQPECLRGSPYPPHALFPLLGNHFTKTCPHTLLPVFIPKETHWGQEEPIPGGGGTVAPQGLHMGSGFCLMPLQKLQPVSRELVTDLMWSWALPTTWWIGIKPTTFTLLKVYTSSIWKHLKLCTGTSEPAVSWPWDVLWHHGLNTQSESSTEQFPFLTIASLPSLSPLAIPSKGKTLVKKAWSFFPFPCQLTLHLTGGLHSLQSCNGTANPWCEATWPWEKRMCQMKGQQVTREGQPTHLKPPQFHDILTIQAASGVLSCRASLMDLQSTESSRVVRCQLEFL